ncbi:MAG: hypothetical protein EPO31_04140 [Gammaproteobacteria bacterium]|nr:MAG: hypothetical protein EPO31_04140 [Gammaproteobacteria bacterium]
MRIQGLTVDQALASLKASNEGLIPAEAARRLGEFGPDRVECITGERLLPRLRGHDYEPLGRRFLSNQGVLKIRFGSI